LNTYNTTCKDVNGHTKLSLATFKYTKTGQNFKLEINAPEEAAVNASELEGIDEVLEMEEEHRAQPLLRKAQLLTDRYYGTRDPATLASVVECYRELERVDAKRQHFYAEMATLFSAKLAGEPITTPPANQRHLAEVLELLEFIN
jgi:hypothetical protein